jgi:hypothetical protein
MSDKDEITPTRPKMDWWWYAPEYFSRWRLFPRAFISMYIYLLYRVVEWFMALPDPNMNQAGLVSVVVGAGAAWFGLYVNSVGSNKESVSPVMRVSETQTTTTRTVEPVNKPTPKPVRKTTSNKFDIK